MLYMIVVFNYRVRAAGERSDVGDVVMARGDGGSYPSLH